MNKILFVSDIHLGLVSDLVDRTQETIRVIKKDVAIRANKLVDKGHNVDIVFGGDIFHKNTPSESNIASFIQIINMFSEFKCNLYIMSGNHDSVSDKKRLSCLSFIKKLSEMYNYVFLIDDIKAIKYKTTDAGKFVLVFLPHINNAHLEKYKEYKTTQDYINKRTEKLYAKLGNGVPTIVFTHLDIKGAIAGDEANLLMKSTVSLPECIVANEDCKILPTIVSGHIHLASIQKNINIIGSPIYTDFSDCDLVDKYIAEITLPTDIRGVPTIDLHKTHCNNFIQITIDLHKKTGDISKDILEIISNKLETVSTSSFLKIDLAVSSSSLSVINLSKIEDSIQAKYGYTVKKIIPKVIRMNRDKRNKELKIGLKPIESFKIFIDNDKSLKKSSRLEISNYAEKYFENL